jgi:hypothetical protein
VFVIPRLFFGLIVGMPILASFFEAAIIFGWLSLYFYLLDRIVKPQTSWLILFVGLLITVLLVFFLRILIF